MAACSPRGRGHSDLDNGASYQSLDPNGMLDFAVELPSQVEEAAGSRLLGRCGIRLRS